MSLLRLEVKKLIKQKKYVWLFLLVLLTTGAIFSINSYQRSRLQGNWEKYNGLPELTQIEAEWVLRETELIRKRDHGELTDIEEKQLKYTNEMAESIQRLRVCKTMGRWAEVPRYKITFVNTLDKYLEAGGEFSALEGLEKEIELEKNNWLLEYGLSYELESYPLTPHLFLQQSSTFLLSILGIAILMVLFGTTITEEREKCTWQTLKTQPISKAKLLLSKYFVFLLITVIFIVMVIGLGLLLPLILKGDNLNFNYPQVIIQGDNFTIISTAEYLLRGVVLFICASSITFSVGLLMSRWISKSVHLYFGVGLVMAVGYLGTAFIEKPFNPFYFLQFNGIINSIPQKTDWLYILFAIMWSGLFIGLAIYAMNLPEKQINAGVIRINKPFAKGNTRSRGHLLWNLFVFELRKIKREGIFKTFLIMSLVIVIAGQLSLSRLSQQRRDEYFSELDWRISELNNKIIENKQEVEWLTKQKTEEVYPELDFEYDYINDNYVFYDDFDYEVYIKHLEDSTDYLYQEIDKIENAKLAYQEKDWKTFHEYQLHVVEMALDYHLTPVQEYLLTTFMDIDRYNEEVTLMEKKWLIDKNIQPTFAGEYISTIHQNWRDSYSLHGAMHRIGWRGEELTKDQWESQNKKADSSGMFILYHGFDSYIYFIPIILLLFLYGGGLAKEKGKKPTYNFLRTQPFTEKDIYLSKAFKIIAITFIGILAISLFAIVTGTALNRFGDWEYPILHYNSWKETSSPNYEGLKAGYGYGYHFINLGEYLIKGTFLLAALSIFFMAISIVLSLFFKKSLSVFAGTVIILAAGYHLSTKKYLQMTYKSPFTYFDIPRVLNGEIATKLNEPRINAVTGIIVLILFTVLIILSGYLFTKRSKLVKILQRVIKKQSISN